MTINEQRIREFAYQIWESEGKPLGHAQRHWEMAYKLASSHAASEPQHVAANEPQPAASIAAVTPPRKTRAKAVADVSAKSLIDTQPMAIAEPVKAKRPSRAKKPKATENESA